MPYPAPRRAGSASLALLAFGLIGRPSPCVARGRRRPQIDWRDDLAQAQAEAVRDLPLWIQFTGPWCINCRRMDRATSSTRCRHRVPRPLRAGKLRSDEYEALALSLGLTLLPSTVIVRPKGEVVDKYEGYIEPERFEASLGRPPSRGPVARAGRGPREKKRWPPGTARSRWRVTARSACSRSRSWSRAGPS